MLCKGCTNLRGTGAKTAGAARRRALKTTVGVDTARSSARNDSPDIRSRSPSPVSRLRAVVIPLLCAPEPCLPRPVAGPRFPRHAWSPSRGRRGCWNELRHQTLPVGRIALGSNAGRIPAVRRKLRITRQILEIAGAHGFAVVTKSAGGRPRPARAQAEKNYAPCSSASRRWTANLARRLEPRRDADPAVTDDPDGAGIPASTDVCTPAIPALNDHRGGGCSGRHARSARHTSVGRCCACRPNKGPCTE